MRQFPHTERLLQVGRDFMKKHQSGGSYVGKRCSSDDLMKQELSIAAMDWAGSRLAPHQKQLPQRCLIAAHWTPHFPEEPQHYPDYHAVNPDGQCAPLHHRIRRAVNKFQRDVNKIHARAAQARGAAQECTDILPYCCDQTDRFEKRKCEFDYLSRVMSNKRVPATPVVLCGLSKSAKRLQTPGDAETVILESLDSRGGNGGIVLMFLTRTPSLTQMQLIFAHELGHVYGRTHHSVQFFSLPSVVAEFSASEFSDWTDNQLIDYAYRHPCHDPNSLMNAVLNHKQLPSRPFAVRYIAALASHALNRTEPHELILAPGALREGQRQVSSDKLLQQTFKILHPHIAAGTTTADTELPRRNANSQTGEVFFAGLGGLLLMLLTFIIYRMFCRSGKRPAKREKRVRKTRR